jgi:hypothetical protein|tara:strand:+ start:291 stop:662 length:372 start_codon:yes stop_codon:yes gene_type:complete
MKCPSCGLTNPPEAIKCDCGFNFNKNVQESPIDRQTYKHPLHSQHGKNPSEKNITHNLEEEVLRCRECGSKQLTSNKQGYGWKKGVAVGVCTVGVGFFAGFINSNKVWLTCLQCGHRWKPGKS